MRELALSGDGQVLFLLTGANRLLRYHTDSGQTEQLAPRFAYQYQSATYGVQGSLLTIFGTGLSGGSAQALYPLPTSLGGVSLEAGGIPLLLKSVSPSQITAQIPFDLPLGSRELRVPPGDGPFTQAPINLLIVDFQPSWPAPVNEFARHPDLSRPVTRDDPARPGEIVSLDLTGLGAVTPPILSGVPAPADRVSRVARALQARLRGSRQEDIELKVVDAILVPGVLATYRVSLLIPDAASLNADVNGYFLGTIEIQPPGPLGSLVTQFGAVPIKVVN